MSTYQEQFREIRKSALADINAFMSERKYHELPLHHISYDGKPVQNIKIDDKYYEKVVFDACIKDDKFDRYPISWLDDLELLRLADYINSLII